MDYLIILVIVLIIITKIAKYPRFGGRRRQSQADNHLERVNKRECRVMDLPDMSTYRHMLDFTGSQESTAIDDATLLGIIIIADGHPREVIAGIERIIAKVTDAAGEFDPGEFIAVNKCVFLNRLQF